MTEPIKWSAAPDSTSWGASMRVADIEIDKDHTLTLFCEADQVEKVNAMFAEVERLREELARLTTLRPASEWVDAELYKEGYHGLLKMISKAKAMEPGCPVFLATPPQGSPPTRRPLTDEELTELARQEQLLLVCDDFDALKEIARAIERAHKIGGNDE